MPDEYDHLRESADAAEVPAQTLDELRSQPLKVIGSTWLESLMALLAVYMNGDAYGRTRALDHFKEMAGLADATVARHKNDVGLHNELQYVIRLLSDHNKHLQTTMGERDETIDSALAVLESIHYRI